MTPRSVKTMIAGWVGVGKELKGEFLFNGTEQSPAKCFKIINGQNAGVN